MIALRFMHMPLQYLQHYTYPDRLTASLPSKRAALRILFFFRQWLYRQPPDHITVRVLKRRTSTLSPSCLELLPKILQSFYT